jgi:putative flippase GtrA
MENVMKIKALYEKYKDFIMEVIHFGIVGVMNTLLGYLIMSGLYNLAHWNYWVSSGTSYFIGSVFSYYMNGKVTFKVENKDKWLPWRFAINIVACYGLAYGIARPLIRYLLSAQPPVVVDNVAMVLGMCLFIVMNFFGQKLFVFRTGRRESKHGA